MRRNPQIVKSGMGSGKKSMVRPIKRSPRPFLEGWWDRRGKWRFCCTIPLMCFSFWRSGCSWKWQGWSFSREILVCGHSSEPLRGGKFYSCEPSWQLITLKPIVL